MRVAFVTESWVPSVDGVVTRLENTVRELILAGHEVLVVAPTVGPTTAGVRQQETRHLRLRFLYGGRPWALPDRKVLAALAEFRPDVVHVVNPVLMGAAAARRIRRHWPMVASYHTDVTTYASHYHLGWLRPIIRTVMRRVYRGADVRLATSDVGREQLADIGIGGVELWARGVDRWLFRPDRDREALRAKLGADPETPLALYVGRLAPEKGCDRLLPLATSERAPSLHVALVGDGPDRDRLEERFYGTRSTFVGYLHGSELADAYASADVFVFPSLTDTLGLVLLEAMATRLPIVAADSPVCRQTLAGYPMAAFADPDDPDGFLGAAHRLLSRVGQSDPPAVDPLVADPGDPDDPDPPRPAGEGEPGACWEPAPDWAEVTTGLAERYDQAVRGRAARAPRPHRRLRRFVAVGVSNAAVDLAVFNGLILIHPTRSASVLVVYNTVAVLCALLNSYLLNSRWTFSDRAAGVTGRRWRQRALFALQGGINLGVNDLVVFALSRLLQPVLGLPSALASNSAKVGAMMSASAVSYFLMHLMVFRRVVSRHRSHPRRTQDTPGPSGGPTPRPPAL